MPKGVYKRGVYSLKKNSVGQPELHFWKRVDKENGPVHPVHGKCWIWVGCLYKGSGYGQFRNMRAHRFSYSMCCGVVPDGLFVLHKCDNPPCVNPSHLFIGTPLDNMTDKMVKGRWDGGTKSPCNGEENGRAKLTQEDVDEIRSLAEKNKAPFSRYVTRQFLERMSTKHGVCIETIRSIILRKTWKVSK